MTARRWCAGFQSRSGGRSATHRWTARLRTCAALLAALVCSFSPLPAGGPRAVTGLGEPMVWDTSGPVVYNPDPGPLGLLSNAAARALLAEAFAEWAAGPSDITFVEGAPLGLNVNANGFAFTNPAHFNNFYRVHADGRSPVIFDHDGSIIETLFGIGARFEILGVASIDTPIGLPTTITGASIIINGAFYDGIGLPESPDDVTLAGLKAAMVHEIGHFINLDHSVLNHELALDDNPGNDIYVPSMFPLAVLDEAALADTNPDDELAAQNLYPAGLSDRFIYGTVSFSGVPFQGANVVIRKLSDPLMSAYSLVSGGRFFPCNPGSLCDPCNTVCDPGNPFEQGAFQADYFPTDDDYTVCVEQIDTRFAHSNDTFVGPLATPPIMPGPEECFDSEESFMQADDPDDSDPVTAGGPGLDIALNALPSSDPFEPNNTLGTGAPLADLPAGQDTAAGVLGAGDLDVFNVPVTAGQRVRIDIDAAELGSALDAVVGFYDASNTLVALSDDAVDPDSQAFSTDAALEVIAGFTGTGKVVVSSFPDLDQNAVGGVSTGGYWVRVQVATDTDGDGVSDGQDICPSDPRDDTDRDSVCFDFDNCPTFDNPLQFELAKLNGPLVGNGDVASAPKISPDGTIVVYRADQDTDEVFELYSVPIGGGTPTRLSGTLVAGGGVSAGTTAFAISPDGTRVIYLADQDTDEVFELYSVPIGGGSSTKLNGTLVTGGDVSVGSTGIVISPDSTKVVYLADQNTDNFVELFSVPIGGGTPTQLAALTGGLTGTTPLVSPDGSRVIYRAGGLFSVPIGGGTSVQLNTGGNVVDVFTMTPDGSRVVYAADQDTGGVTELYSVPIGGGSSTKHNGPLVTGGDVLTGFKVSPDGSRVVYVADQDTNDLREIYSAPMVGGASTKLNGTITAGAGVWDAFGISPDSSRVVYRQTFHISSAFLDLYSAPIGGGPAVRLNSELVSDGNISETFLISPDSSRVVYHADQEFFNYLELYSVPIGGGAPIAISRPSLSDVLGMHTLALLADGPRVVYLAEVDIGNVTELLSVPVGGGTPVKLNGPLIIGGDVSLSFAISNDGTRAVYLADQETDQVLEIYAVDTVAGSDSDNDGVLNGCDVCVETSDLSQDDTDSNGLGDACQTCALGADPDADNVCGAADNCPAMANTTQADFDGDAAGDACDSDDDDDGLADVVETDTGTFVSSDSTGTDPLDPDSDDDGATDGDEVLAGTDPNDPASETVPVAFGAARTIASVNTPHEIFAADIDGDGDIDGLSASQNGDRIEWYENDGASPPQWTPRAITSAADGAQSVYAADIDGDGHMDVLSASFVDDKIAWYENDGASPPGWTARTISANADGAFSVFAADLDDDGDMDVLSASQLDDTIAWYRNDGAAPPLFTEHTISTTVADARSVFAADLNGDAALDVLSASPLDDTVIWYQSDGASLPGFTERTISAIVDGPYTVFASDVDGDGDIDALSASVFDNTIAWYENSGAAIPAWTGRTISTTAAIARWVSAADVDGDGDVDALSASESDDTIAWHENDGASPPGWTEHAITTSADGAAAVLAADLDGDGDLDALMAARFAGAVAWHENRMIHSNAAFPEQSVIHTGADNAQAVFAADVDGDGDSDALSASLGDDELAWYENTDGSGAFGPQQVISTAGDGVASVFAADVDGDGDTDVLSASIADDEISWYQNNGGGSFGAQQMISNAADGARAVFTADIDGDGDTDALSASLFDNTIAWYENDGTPGGLGDWVERAISTTALEARSVFAADIDGDGDMDVLSAASGDNTIAWYENDGTPLDGGWAARAISFAANFPCSVRAADVNGDGDMDVLSASSNDDKIAWYESDGTPANGGWTARTISDTADLATSVFAADLDHDGDLDVLSSSEADNTIAWYENNGASPPAWAERTIASSATILIPASVFAADIDGDGRTDALSASQLDDKIAWYRNRGGQFKLATTPKVLGTMADGVTEPLLRIDYTSNGRAGDSTIELASLELLVTDASSQSLSSDEANALIERLSIHLDDGSGVFEPSSDLQVAIVETLALSPQIIELTPGDPRVRVAAGETKRLFVAVKATNDASAQSPNAYRLAHLTESSSTARDVATGALLTMQFAANVSTATIAAADDVTGPTVTAVYPANNTVDVSPSTSVVVFFSEEVDPATAPAGVALYVSGVKVPAGVTTRGPVVILDPVSSLSLATDYLVRVTQEARDHSGNPTRDFVSTFDTADTAGTGDIDAGDIGESGGGATLEGSNADDNSGFSVAALGDVNATAASHGIADLIIGAPNADAGAMDAGHATLVFGAPGLQSSAGSVASVIYRTGTLQDFVGETVARAGDLDGDTVQDFLIGAPRSDQTGVNAGVVYLVFGDPGLDEIAGSTLDLDNLASCSVPTLCGVKLTGAAAGDLAGAALSWAGDINGDGFGDVLIGAPGASPGGRLHAGRVYLIFGPLGADLIPLSQVGATIPGLVLNGESAGDNFGAAVAAWPDPAGDGFDDLLIGAPGAGTLDSQGVPILNAGYVYAIHGGTGPGHLDDTATPGVIEASRVANGAADQVAGMVFIGDRPGGNIGRSLSGAVDTDGDGVYDILIGGNGVAFLIPGDDPKTRTGATPTPGTGTGGGMRAGIFSAVDDFHAIMFTTGNDDPLTVGPAGDINNDGYDDFIIGSPLADGAAGVDSGKAYVVLGSPAPGGEVKQLANVGDAIAGFIVEGAQAGDNLGASVGGGFDLNADSVDDGLAGAPFADTDPSTPVNAGETYVISPLRPTEVVSLMLSPLGGGITRLEWSVPDLAFTYNVYRGLLSTLVAAGQVKTSDMTQLACGITTDADADLLPDRDDAALPPAGNAFFYLATAENLLGEGPLGPADAVPERVNDLQCP